MKIGRRCIEITNTNGKFDGTLRDVEDANEGERIDEPHFRTSAIRSQPTRSLGCEKTGTTVRIVRNVDGGIVIEEGTTDGNEDGSTGETNVVIMNTMITRDGRQLCATIFLIAYIAIPLIECITGRTAEKETKGRTGSEGMMKNSGMKIRRARRSRRTVADIIIIVDIIIVITTTD